jgi:hypothetical protein
MVDFNPEENIRNLTEEEKELIKQAVKNTYGKMFPNGKSLDYLYSQFKNLIEPNFTVSCGKCKTRVINFFQQRSKNW